MSNLYCLREGVLGQEVDLFETPARRVRWLKRGARFFIHRDEHAWVDGCPDESYCTILVEDECKCYNVCWRELETFMERLEPDRRQGRLHGSLKVGA